MFDTDVTCHVYDKYDSIVTIWQLYDIFWGSQAISSSFFKETLVKSFLKSNWLQLIRVGAYPDCDTP